jgi:hypothetical protein
MRSRRLQKGRGPIWLALALCAGASAFITIPFLTGCRKTAEQAPDLVMRHEVSPQPPRVGPATITVSLSDAAGKPITGASVNLEGNMSHPGMVPVFGAAREIEAGRYQAFIEFTMGGDWIVLVKGALPDGRKLEREFEVKGVKAN